MALLTDGYSTRISFGGITIYEKGVTPPGIDGGGEVDTTTMASTIWRSKQPKALSTLTNCKATVAYDTADYATLLAQVHVVQTITITFSDATTLVFEGWLDKFIPGECTEGEQPTAEIEIIPEAGIT